MPQTTRHSIWCLASINAGAWARATASPPEEADELARYGDRGDLRCFEAQMSYRLCSRCCAFHACATTRAGCPCVGL